MSVGKNLLALDSQSCAVQGESKNIRLIGEVRADNPSNPFFFSIVVRLAKNSPLIVHALIPRSYICESAAIKLYSNKLENSTTACCMFKFSCMFVKISLMFFITSPSV